MATAPTVEHPPKLNDKVEDIPKPPEYMVILHNDPVTPFELVVGILAQEFKLGHREATEIMLKAHNEGRAIVANLTREIAEMRVHRVNTFAGSMGFPLTLTAEPM